MCTPFICTSLYMYSFFSGYLGESLSIAVRQGIGVASMMVFGQQTGPAEYLGDSIVGPHVRQQLRSIFLYIFFYFNKSHKATVLAHQCDGARKIKIRSLTYNDDGDDGRLVMS